MIPLTENAINEFAQTGYWSTDSFLPDIWALQLRDTLKRRYHNQEFKKAQIGHPQNRQENAEIRGDHILWLTSTGENEAERSFLSQLQLLMTQLRRELYLPLKWIEAHYAFYDSRQGYQKHYDNFQGGKLSGPHFCLLSQSRLEKKRWRRVGPLSSRKASRRNCKNRASFKSNCAIQK